MKRIALFVIFNGILAQALFCDIMNYNLKIKMDNTFQLQTYGTDVFRIKESGDKIYFLDGKKIFFYDMTTKGKPKPLRVTQIIHPEEFYNPGDQNLKNITPPGRATIRAISPGKKYILVEKKASEKNLLVNLLTYPEKKAIRKDIPHKAEYPIYGFLNENLFYLFPSEYSDEGPLKLYDRQYGHVADIHLHGYNGQDLMNIYFSKDLSTLLVYYVMTSFEGHFTMGIAFCDIPDFKKVLIEASLLSAPMVTRIEASSYIDYRNMYHPFRVIDGKAETAWLEKAEGPGIGEYIEIEFDREISLTAISFMPGYFDSRWYNANNRIKKLKVELDDKSYIFSFTDTMRLQKAGLPSTASTQNVRLIIKEVYPSGKDNDTALSEITFYYKDDPIRLDLSGIAEALP